jgi:hypothetical protein
MVRALSVKQAAGILVFAVIIQLLVALAAFGPTVTSSPRNLPLGLVNDDLGAEGGANVGSLLSTGIAEAPRAEVAWTMFASEAELRAAMARRQVYGGIVLPFDLSERVGMLPDAGAQPAEALVLVNEGMHPAGAQAARGILTAVVEGAAGQLAEQRLVALGAADAVLAPEQVMALARPLQAQLVSAHAASDSALSSQLPLVLTVLLWLGTLVASLFLFIALHRPGQMAASFTRTQLSASLGLAVVLPAPVLAIASWLLGIPTGGGVALYALLALTALAFLLLQAAVLNWLGFAGWPLLVILWLFGPSVLAVPPEFLAAGYRTWIYSWIPFRYTFEALQGLLSFGGETGEIWRSVLIVGLYGLIALVAVLRSVRRLGVRDLAIHPLARRFRAMPAAQ